MNDRDIRAVAELLERAYFHHERSRWFGSGEAAVEDLRHAVSDLARAVNWLLPSVSRD